MVSRNFTIETRLEKNEELIAYFEDYITKYNKVYREMWRIMTASDYSEKYAKPSIFVTKMCQKYNMLKRTINSIRYEIKGRIRALQALKETELKQLELRIRKKSEKIEGLIEYINQMKSLARENKVTPKQLAKYQRCKKSLYYQKNKLNKMKQKYKKLEIQIDENILKIGFGGKRFFEKQYNLEENGYKTHKKWYYDYVKARDKNIFYLGSRDESCGNQMFQLIYQDGTDDFLVKIRKENDYCKSNTKEEKYLILHHVKFNHLQKQLVKALKERKQPISFRIHRVKNRWYLQCIFDIRFEEENYCTYARYGVFGLDYNDGFIEMSETDESGNLIHQYHYDLKYHGTGKKAENEIRQTISEIVKLAEQKGKDMIIENLDFKKTKAKTTIAKTNKGKNYNRMLHLFDYSRYKETLKNCCHRHQVVLQLVSPRNTSKIGKQKYSFKKKLNTHQAASYVIARKGQGFNDRLVV